MPIEITMPALSPTMTEGNLAKWLKKEGDEVKSGDVIAEIETDKATMEVEAVDEGTLGKIIVQEGTQGVAVNQVIALPANVGAHFLDHCLAWSLPDQADVDRRGCAVRDDGSSAVANEPVCRHRASTGSGASSATSHSMRKSYVAMPAASVAIARLVDTPSPFPPSTFTALASRCPRIISPNASRPRRVLSVTGTPSRPKPSATFAGLPPGCAVNVRPPRCPTKSTSASPTTMNTRLTSRT